jgi:mRNA interferase HigB
MNVVNRQVLIAGWTRHADARRPVQAWLAEAECDRWTGPKDIKRRFASASILADNVVIFNIKGNRYRLAVKVHFSSGIVLVKWFGTHAEYDRKKF